MADTNTTGARGLEASLDTAIAILTKGNALALIAGVAVTGLIALFKKNGLPVPTFTPAELNAAMMAAATDAVAHAEELKAKIRAENPTI